MRAERFVDQVHRAHDLIERQVRHIIDQAELGRQPDEFAGRLDLAVLVAQANQRFDADHFLAADIDFRLERAAEAAVADGQPQPLLLLHPGGHRPPHVGIEQRGAALGALLDAIHGGIGGAAQHLVIAAVVGKDAEPDRSRGEYFKPFDQEWLFELLQQAVDELGKILVAGKRVHDQQKLVAADAAENIGRADIGGDPLRHLHQQRVADRVRIVVVDVLEIVDVEKRQGEPRRRLRAGQQLLDMLLDQGAVRQSGQVVEIGAPRQLDLGLLALGVIDRGRHQHGAVMNACRAAVFQKRTFAARAGNAILRHGHSGRVHLRRNAFAAVWCGVRRRRLEKFGSHVVGKQRLAVLRLHRHAHWQVLDDGREHAQRAARLPLAFLCFGEELLQLRRLVRDRSGRGLRYPAAVVGRRIFHSIGRFGTRHTQRSTTIPRRRTPRVMCRPIAKGRRKRGWFSNTMRGPRRKTERLPLPFDAISDPTDLFLLHLLPPSHHRLGRLCGARPDPHPTPDAFR